MKMLFRIVAAVYCCIHSLGAVAQDLPLPPKNEVPINAQSFCAGFNQVYATTKQNFKKQADYLCAGGNPSSLLNQILSNPYQGAGAPSSFLRTIAANVEGQYLRLVMGYGVRVPQNAVQAVLRNEKTLTLDYFGPELRVMPRMIRPARNEREAEATLGSELIASCKADTIRFDDVTRYHINLYKMYPNNYDFFLVVRTLVQPTLQTKESTMLVGVMPDPQNPAYSIVITALEFLLHNRDHPERVRPIIENYILWYMQKVYETQTASN